MKHKHADLIHAWADGAEIQYKNNEGVWIDFPGWYEPVWNSTELEYRIKPEPKPDVVFEYHSFLYNKMEAIKARETPNIRIIYDGETGELKSAEVLK